jgi:Zn-dependent protease with chaperone function
VKFDPALPDDSVNVVATHPLRDAATLVAGIVAVVVVLMVVLAGVVELAVPRIPASLEARIFPSPDVYSALGVGVEEVSDPRSAELARVLDRLAAHWAENPYELQLAVFEHETPNAFAFPGGFVAVTTGLLDSASSENELAFVLAHELGHFRNRDQLRGLGRGVAFGLLVGFLGVGGSGSAATVAGVVARITSAGFSREQESAADDFGLALVNAEYGHVAGATEFFERLPKPDNAIERELEGYLSTHPLSAERIDAMRELAVERGWSFEGPLVPHGAERAPDG